MYMYLDTSDYIKNTLLCFIIHVCTLFSVFEYLDEKLTLMFDI